jgi:hypothetical protein
LCFSDPKFASRRTPRCGEFRVRHTRARAANAAVRRDRAAAGGDAARPAGRDADGDRYWSDRVTRQSNALDLEPGVCEPGNGERIARSLQKSAEASQRRKSAPYRSAMSMLTFYINRGGRNLPLERRRVLEDAKGALRRLDGRG